MTDDRWGDELAGRVAAEGRIVASLVELERHPGHALLSGGSPTGRTAQRWAAAQAAMTGLWRDFGIYQSVVAAAREAHDPAERHRLLLEPSVEVARTVVGKRITGDVEHVETVTLEELAARMDEAFGEVHGLLVTCDELHQAFLSGLAPLAEHARAARTLAAGLGDPDAAGALTARIDELDRACTADPLSLADRPPLDVLAELGAEADELTTRLTATAAVRDSWDALLAEVTSAVTGFDARHAEEEQVRMRAQELIAGTVLPAPPDRRPALRHRLAALTGPGGWVARAAAVDELRTAVADASTELRTAHDLAGGLLERRAELRGRFEAYRAKANRLGHAERPDLLALDQDIRRLLWSSPCDLAAATRALTTYQRAL